MFDHFSSPAPAPLDRLATLVDVTLRDGGFEVGFGWPEPMFSQIPAVVGPVGVDIVELGYIGGVPQEHGVAVAGAHLGPAHVAAASSSSVMLAAMIHPSALRTAPDLQAYKDAGLGMVRLVYHPDWFADIANLAQRAAGCGLSVSVNIALASRYEPAELLAHAAKVASAMSPDVLYVADTCGALTPDMVSHLVTRLTAEIGTQIGFHAHDPLSLAYANSLAAAASGATYLDCSLLGLGRGGGNLSAELMMVRHRLPGRDVAAHLDALLGCREQLAALAGWPAGPLVAAVCGALNLTPVEERALLDFAEGADLDPSKAALWLLTVAYKIPSVRADDLAVCWREDTGQR